MKCHIELWLSNIFGVPIYVLFYYVAQDVFYGKVALRNDHRCSDHFSPPKKLSYRTFFEGFANKYVWIFWVKLEKTLENSLF